MDPRRPDPDALLAQVVAADEQARRGRLKVFLGAAPGVGKTYAMLSAARKGENVFREQGADLWLDDSDPFVDANPRAATLGLEAGAGDPRGVIRLGGR